MTAECRPRQGSSASYEYAILGGGPAGLQLGYFLKRAGRKYVIFEAAPAPGAFFRRFPRHRRLLSINKVHTGSSDSEINLRFDWNSLLADRDDLRFTRWSKSYFPDANDLADYLEAFAARLELNVEGGTRIVRVSRDGCFLLTDHAGHRCTATRLVVATGLSCPYVPPIPGIELGEIYGDMPIDPADYRDARVLIIGKGNSGFETGNHLTETAALIHIASPHSVTMAWSSHYPGHLRAINNDFLDTYQLKSQNAVLDAEILKIARAGGELAVTVRYSHAGGETETLLYDRVLVCTGFRFDDALFDDSCRPSLTDDRRLPQMTSSWESTSVPDLFFAGILMSTRDAKRTNSAFIHGFRYNVRAMSRLLDVRYHERAWPSEPVRPTPEAIADRLLARFNTTSALWQQFGFLCDVLTFGDEGVSLYQELPVDYVQEAVFPRAERFLMATLEFGTHHGDPFRTPRHPRPELARRSTFLHPVLRLFEGSALLSEHHVLENLLGEWRDEHQHVEPLRSYLRTALQHRVAPGKRKARPPCLVVETAADAQSRG